MTSKKKTLAVATAFVMAASFFQPAFAHVAVKPAEVGIATFQTFTVGVPVEKDQPTTGLRIVLPDGLEHVTPNVKPGWTVTVKEEGEGDEAKATEIEWTGGTIPSGQRDEFAFSAKVPAEETSLQWKAYQKYEDGTTVSWDHDPEASHDHDSADGGPYSVTNVVDDLAAVETATSAATTYSIIAVILSLCAIALSWGKSKE